MKAENISELFGACYEAKRIVDLMPALPKGMKPSHIHGLDVICRLQQANGAVRVSDIGAALHVANPGITRLVDELVALRAVEKEQSSEDKRVYTVRLTALGQKYYKKYLQDYHNQVAEQLADISGDDVKAAARVIHEVYGILSKGEKNFGKRGE